MHTHPHSRVYVYRSMCLYSISKGRDTYDRGNCSTPKILLIHTLELLTTLEMGLVLGLSYFKDKDIIELN